LEEKVEGLIKDLTYKDKEHCMKYCDKIMNIVLSKIYKIIDEKLCG
jgi:hypothetical protein